MAKRVAAQLGIVCLVLAITLGCEPATEPTANDFQDTLLIDPNAASEAELGTVPGLNEASITKILSNRPFPTPSALHAVIGEDLRAEEERAVYGAMFIRVGLNTGAEADYKLIPSSMSPRKLAHEFEEYRPYESIDQFRREMAKYVSEEEVAYLARYVTLD